MTISSAKRVIGIIGGGPRALTVIERLTAYAVSGGTSTNVVVIDDYDPGAGMLWQTALPGTLITNTLAADNSVFPGHDLQPPVPILRPRSVFEWGQAMVAGEVEISGLGVATEAIVEEAAMMQPTSFPSRRFLGCYLRWHFQELQKHSSPQLTISHRRARVVEIEPQSDGRHALRLQEKNGRSTLLVDAVVLATGHTANHLDASQRILAEAAHKAGLDYRTPGFIEDHLSPTLPAGRNVFIRGAGLHFHDLLALLTVGRGGHFVTQPNGNLVYIAGGDEPRLLVTSRSGLPYLARPSALLTYDVSALHNRIAQSVAKGRDHFGRNIWPLIQDELLAAAYSSRRDVDLAALITSMTDPLSGRHFPTVSALNQTILERLEEDIQAASVSRSHPSKIMAEIMRTLAGPLGRLRSVKEFASGPECAACPDWSWYERAVAALGSGPPVIRIRELVALMHAGIVTFIGRNANIEVKGGAFRAFVSDAQQVEASILVEARAPLRRAVYSSEPVLVNLLRRGQARFKMTGEQNTGALDHDLSYRLIDQLGHSHKSIFAIGLPILGADFSTATEVVPGSQAKHASSASIIARALLHDF